MPPETASWTLPGLVLTDLTLEVPLDHDRPEGPRLSVFARVAAAEGGADRPYLVYLQGGPGFEAPRPALESPSPSWLPRALEDFQVVLLDQRGTGRSTPVGLDVVLPAGAIPGAATLREAAPEDQAAYLAHFRADAIVRDAEAVRAALGARSWSLLGQSFGGFTTLRYLSEHADRLDLTLFTGGLPVIGPRLDEVYTTTWEGMVRRSEEFYARFDGDRDRMRRLADLARAGELVLQDGQAVSPDRLRTVGHLLGASGGAERLHYLLELDPVSPAFRQALADALPFGGANPIYTVLHESCWADGQATRWAADRTMPEQVRADPTLLAGEHVHRSLLDEDPQLAPWKEVADILAEHEWPALYDSEALRAAQVPGAAAVYFADAYVPAQYSLETAALLPKLRPWVTSEYEHNGLRASGDGVFTHLLDLARGRRTA
ncbi:alpha/beta fold hydrolase [Brachybacterium hainanense]|uniref:Alpha/beta fold hydrolase n=1 Tax=Brachybacterium hainanense TaxID=1541174 RepID=A0ABV6RD46_9MICO